MAFYSWHTKIRKMEKKLLKEEKAYHNKLERKIFFEQRTTAAIRSAPHSLRSLRCSGFATFFLRLRDKPAYSAPKKRRIATDVVRNRAQIFFFAVFKSRNYEY